MFYLPFFILQVKKLVPNLRIFNAKPIEQNISKSTSRNVAPEINPPKETNTKHKFEKNGNAKTDPEKKSANSNPEFNDASESNNEKKKKRSTKNEEKKHGDEKIDDADIPFLDVILSETDNHNNLSSNKKKRKGEDKLVGAFVVDHTKKNKKKEKGKTVISGSLAIKLLSPPPDIGTGGSSTWD